MRIILGLVVSLTLILSTNAALFFPDVALKIEPKLVEVQLDPPPKPPNDPHLEPENYHSPPGSPGGSETAGEEDKQESDIAENLSDILDAITSIISLAGDGGTSTTITSTISLPTAAHPYLSAQNLFNSCSSQASSSYAVAGLSRRVCIEAGDPCVTKPSGPKTAVASMQSRCLCPSATGLFDGYLGSCRDYVQAQTQLATQSGLGIAAAFCTSDASVSPTTAAVSSIPALATVSETTAPQAVSTSTGAATVLAPIMISQGGWYPVWWGVVVLVGFGWAGYS